ncbi:MAG: TonB-dependent receptor, partial [Halioglobus sp.]|nr:TonB-dependent receptor [Halioglobus sp.]
DSYKETFPGSGTRELVGTAGADDGANVYPENRVNVRLGIRGNNWNAGWTMRWIDESEDLLRPASITDDAVAEDILYHDIMAAYTFQNLTLSAGIDNLTDEEPPRFHSAFNANTAPGTYDTYGIRSWVRVILSF